MQFLVFLATFFAVAGLIVGVYLFLNRRALAEAAAVRARMHGEGEDVIFRPPSILKDTTASHIPFLNRLLQGRAFTEAIRQQLEQAGFEQKPAVFLLATAVSMAIGIALGEQIAGIFGLLVAVTGIAAPWVWLVVRQRRRRAAFEQQFPDALDMLASAMRAGYSFQAATHFIGEEVPPPVGPEFMRFYDEQRLGVDVRTALLGLQARVDSINVKMFVTAVLIQRETGGNLTELLDNLSTLMRDRVTVQGQIDTLTAEPKLSARLLTVLPILLFFILRAVNPTFMAPFATSSVGHWMLAIAGVSVIAGYVMLMRIARIDV